jgi:hypothetical protein
MPRDLLVRLRDRRRGDIVSQQSRAIITNRAHLCHLRNRRKKPPDPD